MQILTEPCLQIFDVAHNPAAALKLAEKLNNLHNNGKTYGVFSMFADKDIANTVKPFKHLLNGWHIAELQHSRAATLAQLQQAFTQQQITTITEYDDINTAYQTLLQTVKPNDRIVVFGSFEVLHEIKT